MTGLKLEAFSCYDTLVENLSPLASMPLHTLIVGKTRIKDFSALRGMPLQVLCIEALAVDDPRWLGDLPLVRLIFSPDMIKGDLSVLRNHKTLKQIGTQWNADEIEPGEFWKHWDAQHGRPAEPS